MTALCPRCGNDLTHPTEVREQLCMPCHFDDLDDARKAADPLPPSSWWEMDDAERERATKRQQIGMAGEL